jgi:hypothetical protein
LRIAVVLGLALLGCQDAWVPFSSPEGRFAVEFPTPPVRAESPVETPAGPATMHTHTAKGPSAAYVVAWADYPPEALQADLEQMFDQTRAGLVANLRGELVSEEKLEIQGRPGRALTLRVGGAGTVLEARLVLVDERLYQVAVVNSEGHADTPEAQRFFRSFEILESSP